MLAGSGCATYQNKSFDHLAAFRAGESSSALRFHESDGSKNSRQLHLVEAGRIRLLDGDMQRSHRNFERAIEGVMEFEEGAMIRLKDSGSSFLAATITDDRSIPYNLPGYEAVLALQFQALNSLFMGNPEAAMVEMRRAVFAQDQLADKYEKEVQRAREELEGKNRSAMESVDQRYAAMGPVLGMAKSGFQNPYVWYLAGLMYEAQRDRANAYIAYKKAWELAPANGSLRRDLVRLARTENPQELKEFVEAFGFGPEQVERSPAEVVVFYEEGLISQRYAESFPILLPRGFVNLSFPVYRDGPHVPRHLTAEAGERARQGLEPLASIQALAYHDLRAKIPGITIRNITRAITTQSGAVGSLAGQVGGDTMKNVVNIGMQIFKPLFELADTRAWYSLPMVVQMQRFGVDQGDTRLRLNGTTAGAPLEIPVRAEEGEIKLVWVADLDGRISYGVASLTHARSQPPFFAVRTRAGERVVLGGGGEAVEMDSGRLE